MSTNRRFYTPGKNGAPGSLKRGYLLRWFCAKQNKILQEGPYESEDKALIEQNTRLINGICSWLVFYGD